MLEILLVVVIVAITTAVVVPNLFAGPREQLRSEARQLLTALNAARDEAALGGRVISVSVGPQRIEFLERDLADPNRWSPATRDSLRARQLPGEFILRAEVAAAATRIAFLPSGVSAPFTLALTSPAGTERIAADALGNLALQVQP
ncbi:MAG: GspH/FimT family pseudopilin [Betaproteobacteria bacterium]|nr:GspH/FimT family pseudopilin [Betaproteobacteria bacterium]